jgi:hypothetical protein
VLPAVVVVIRDRFGPDRALVDGEQVSAEQLAKQAGDDPG